MGVEDRSLSFEEAQVAKRESNSVMWGIHRTSGTVLNKEQSWLIKSNKNLPIF